MASPGLIAVAAVVGFLATTLLAGTRAEGLMSLRLDDGTEQVTVADGSGGDLCAAAGCIVTLFLGEFASFDVAVSTGLAAGSLALADLDLSSVVGCTFGSCGSGSGGSLTLSLTNTDFIGPVGNVFVRLGIGGSTTGRVEYEAFFDQSNTAFGTATLLGALGPFEDGAFPASFSGEVTASTVAANPFSLTQVVQVTHLGGTGQITSFDAFARAVPEPAALVLLGSALVAAGVITRLRTRPDKA
jgi:hypothetical protein